ncbi:hypothetical protein [Mesorhizobium sp.]|uniref:hypothetical protein n=1 Tax=Mesorhizobium sp. TaxID=1871066 RepID=UPI0025ED7F74|nr:hypothetical protein [Mesorhizobium sp.]
MNVQYMFKVTAENAADCAGSSGIRSNPPQLAPSPLAEISEHWVEIGDNANSLKETPNRIRQLIAHNDARHQSIRRLFRRIIADMHDVGATGSSTQHRAARIFTRATRPAISRLKSAEMAIFEPIERE